MAVLNETFPKLEDPNAEEKLSLLNAPQRF
jgi:hypothetical protein